MDKKIIRTKRNQKDIIRFVEDLPSGMISGGKASDLVTEDDKDEEKDTKVISISNKEENEAYLVDVMLGLNEDKD